MIKEIKTGKRKGFWQVRVQPRDPITHERVSLPTKYVKNKREATQLERRLFIEFEQGYRLNDGKLDFVTSFEKFLESKRITISPVTFSNWKYSLKVFSKYFQGKKIGELNTECINQFAHQFIKDNPRAGVSSKSSLATRLNHLKCYFDSLVGTVVKTNPVPKNALKQFFRTSDFNIGQSQYVFTDDDLKRIKLQIISDFQSLHISRWGTRLAILIAMETGMRPGEIQALTFKDLIEVDGRKLFRIHDSWSDMTGELNGALKSRPQGESRDCLPLSMELVKILSRYQLKQLEFLNDHEIDNDTGRIFINLGDYRKCAEGRPISQHSFNDMLHKICDNLKIDSECKQLSMYSFRHTVSTKLANKPGMSYPWAASKLGNSVAVFTRTYVKADRDLDNQMMDLWTN